MYNQIAANLAQAERIEAQCSLLSGPFYEETAAYGCDATKSRPAILPDLLLQAHEQIYTHFAENTDHNLLMDYDFVEDLQKGQLEPPFNQCADSQ